MNKYIDNMLDNVDQFFFNMPYITIVGNEIEVENYKKIFEFSSTRIRIIFKRCNIPLDIEGEKLEIKNLRNDSIRVVGVIKNISFPSRGSKDECIKC